MSNKNERKQEIEVALNLIINTLENFSLALVIDDGEIRIMDATNGKKYRIKQGE